MARVAEHVSGLRAAMTERELQDAVMETARILGWRVAHFRAALTTKGWRTPVEAHGAGFPDLVLVRDRVVFAELKGDGGRLSGVQKDWLESFRYAGAEAHVWTPAEWQDGTVEAAFRGPQPQRRAA